MWNGKRNKRRKGGDRTHQLVGVRLLLKALIVLESELWCGGGAVAREATFVQREPRGTREAKQRECVCVCGAVRVCAKVGNIDDLPHGIHDVLWPVVNDKAERLQHLATLVGVRWWWFLVIRGLAKVGWIEASDAQQVAPITCGQHHHPFRRLPSRKSKRPRRNAREKGGKGRKDETSRRERETAKNGGKRGKDIKSKKKRDRNNLGRLSTCSGFGMKSCARIRSTPAPYHLGPSTHLSAPGSQSWP